MTLELKQVWARTHGQEYPRSLLHEAALDNIKAITGKAVTDTLKKPSLCDPSGFLATLEKRIIEHNPRSKGVPCNAALDSLSKEDIQSLWQMERSGGMPNAVLGNRELFVWADTCPVTSEIRRNLCYDEDAERDSDKIYPGSFGNADSLAKSWGVELLSPLVRAGMQSHFDLETDGSIIWLKTPASLRSKGRALRAHSRGIYDDDVSVNNHRDDWGFRTQKLVTNKFPPNQSFIHSILDNIREGLRNADSLELELQ